MRWLLAIALACGCSFDSSGTDGTEATDGGAGIDGAAGRDGQSAACGVSFVSGVLAHYRFDGDLVDSASSFDATGTGEPLAFVPGPSGCGTAVSFSSIANGWVNIADSAAWDLTDGSIDFYMRGEAKTTNAVGIVTRDANGSSQPGHLGMWMSQDNALGARIQNTAGDANRCTGPIPTDRWVHVGVNWGAGGFELWVDGALATGTSIDFGGSVSTCGQSNTEGIDGNANPWVIGADSASAVEGTGLPIDNFYGDGAIDNFRISSQARDFSVFAP